MVRVESRPNLDITAPSRDGPARDRHPFHCLAHIVFGVGNLKWRPPKAANELYCSSTSGRHQAGVRHALASYDLKSVLV